MAKKEVPVAVDQKHDLIESLSEFSRFKSIDRATLMSVLEDVFPIHDSQKIRNGRKL